MNQLTKRNSPRSNVPKPKLKSPLLTKPVRKPSTSHLYRPPVASIRRSEASAPLDENRGKTRRRRPASAHIKSYGRNPPPRRMLERQMSDGSLGMVDLVPGPPPLIMDDSQNNSEAELNVSLSDLHWNRSPSNHKPRGNIYSTTGYEDYSEYMDESHRSHTAHTTNTYPSYGGSDYNGSKGKRRQSQSPHSYMNIFQMIILIALGWYIYDSHHKVKSHKLQLKQYDEERSHLLEQMMWVDQAAKKVHQKYSDLSLMELGKESKEELTHDVKNAREELEKLQVRIQVNDRDYIHENFGDKSIEVALSMGELSDDRLSIALSDDTPHAVATLMKQVSQQKWDDVDYEWLPSGTIKASSRVSTASPMLEFVEPSRGCHEKGSVALRQDEEEGLILLSLRINMESNMPSSESEVCIGRVTRGGLKLLRSRVNAR